MSIAWVPTSVADLEAEARDATGLEDFGDPFYREGLSILLADYEANPYFNRSAAAGARAQIVDLLSRRLRSERLLSQSDGRVRTQRPWFILAWPRSGTTALHRLLCADPSAQGLDYWLGMFPQPRPNEPSKHPDYIQAAAHIQQMQEAAPNAFAQHTSMAGAVDECWLLLMQDFASVVLSTLATVPRYDEWLWSGRMAPAYQRHRALLEMIDNGQGRRWVLKDPSHMMSLEVLKAEYPDLRVICMRRSALAFLPSVASLVFEARRAVEPDVTPEKVGRAQLEIWSRAAWELQRWRAAHPEMPWVDIEQDDLRNDPIGTCRNLYSSFDEELTVEAERQMREKLNEGLHTGATLDRPTLEMFGLVETDIRDAFPSEFV